MAKMYFTFKWGKSIYITQDDLKKILLKYYTKEEVDELLRGYATIEDVAGILSDYVTNKELEVEITHLNDLITDVDGHTIENRELIDELIEQLRTGKILVIEGLYSPDVEYRQFVLVFSEESANTSIYLSLQNNNIGHPLTDTNYWKNLGAVGESISLDNYYTKSESDNKYVNLTTNQTINGVKSFNSLPVFTGTSFLPSDDNFVTKRYIDTNYAKTIIAKRTGRVNFTANRWVEYDISNILDDVGADLNYAWENGLVILNISPSSTSVRDAFLLSIQAYQNKKVWLQCTGSGEKELMFTFMYRNL